MATPIALGHERDKVERTKGAVQYMTDAQLRRQVADLMRMLFWMLNTWQNRVRGLRLREITSLTEQHYKMLQDNRATIERVSNITSGFMGKKVQQQADCKSKRKLSKQSTGACNG